MRRSWRIEYVRQAGWLMGELAGFIEGFGHDRDAAARRHRELCTDKRVVSITLVGYDAEVIAI